MSNNKPERGQSRGKRRLPANVVDNLAGGIDRLAESMGISQAPGPPVAVMDRPDDGKVGVGYTFAGLGVIFVIAVANCPLL